MHEPAVIQARAPDERRRLDLLPVSTTWTFFEGDWHAGNVAIMGPRTQAAWLGSMVFDGARAYDGCAPDLDLHMARINESARRFHLKPVVTEAEWMGAGPRRASPASPPARRSTSGRCTGPTPAMIGGGVKFDPEIHPLVPVPLRGADAGRRGRSPSRSRPIRRPTHRDRAGRRQGRLPLPQQRPRAVGGRRHAASTTACCSTCWATSPSWPTPTSSWSRTASVLTPAPNGTFLDGITRQRTIQLLRAAGETVVEATLALRRLPGRRRDLLHRQLRQALGHHPHRRARRCSPAPMFRKASELYAAFAAASRV